MKTKAEIVQNLLDAGHINAEDAVVLLMGSKEKEYIYVPQPYPYSQWPFYVDPFPFGVYPTVTYGDTTTEITVSVN